MPSDWTNHQPRRSMPSYRTLPPCSVFRVTRSPYFGLLTLLMTVSGVLAGARMFQRLCWLLFNFKPLGFWWEAAFLLVQEGAGALTGMLSILAAIGALRLLTRQQTAGGRMLYRVQRIRASLAFFALLLVTALTALLLWGAVHYRMSVTVIAVVSIVGLTAVFLLSVVSRFYTNTAKMLADVNGSFRQGSFTMGGGVDCLLRWQVSVLSVSLLVPAALALVEGSGLLWLIQWIKPIVGNALARELQTLLTGSYTSVYSMYGLECLQYLLQIGQLALVGLLYGVYRKAHDGRR